MLHRLDDFQAVFRQFLVEHLRRVGAERGFLMHDEHRLHRLAGEWDVVSKDYHTLLDIFDKHIDKINWATTNKPFESWQFIHARYNPETLEEFWESWGNKQHDAVGTQRIGKGVVVVPSAILLV